VRRLEIVAPPSASGSMSSCGRFADRRIVDPMAFGVVPARQEGFARRPGARDAGNHDDPTLIHLAHLEASGIHVAGRAARRQAVVTLETAAGPARRHAAVARAGGLALDTGASVQMRASATLAGWRDVGEKAAEVTERGGAGAGRSCGH
jgi:hypothetical protein